MGICPYFINIIFVLCPFSYRGIHVRVGGNVFRLYPVNSKGKRFLRYLAMNWVFRDKIFFHGLLQI
jgi:hypothetical protein